MGGQSYPAGAGGPALAVKMDENRDFDSMATNGKLPEKSAAPAVHKSRLRSLGMATNRLREEASKDSTDLVV